MLAITRRPRLLVKMTPAARASAPLGASGPTFTLEPLLPALASRTAPGMTAPPQWFVATPASETDEVNSWDLCHKLTDPALGFAGTPAVFAEPDLEQRWTAGANADQAMAIAQGCDRPAAADGRLPSQADAMWFRDASHSQLDLARIAVGTPAAGERVRIAHLDTGYDPNHATVRDDVKGNPLQRNFVDPAFPNDASDRSSGGFVNLGHGTGTLGILGGVAVDGSPLGAAAALEIVPLRVADSVVLLRTSSVAQALDYVIQLCGRPETAVDVITMSMGGLASQAWADAVNALYDLGVFIVTAAGNNFGNLPTHNIVFPARFRRVVAACGVMADGRAYADLAVGIMAGNYGPASKMTTAISGFTPNVPWPRFGCRTIVDLDGRGTSAATPQVAGAAALWIQQHRRQLSSYTAGWQRVEAARFALFSAAARGRQEPFEKLGWGPVQASDAIQQDPVPAEKLARQPEDSASFSFLRVLTGLGVAAAASPAQRMLELEALQLSQQSHEIEAMLPDPDAADAPAPALQQRVIEALVEMPGASAHLRAALTARLPDRVAVPPAGRDLAKPRGAVRLARAAAPLAPRPTARRLEVFTFDPLTSAGRQAFETSISVLEVSWEDDLQPGPVGEYLEVIDVDPASEACYAPVDLNHPYVLARSGLAPSESSPQFHQQMVYGVSMCTIAAFEHALGRSALWAPRWAPGGGDGPKERFVRRLRIYPHAIREANSYYSPDKKALLLGYFPASRSAPGDNLPGGTVFCCLSHDVVAHETTHALLDGVHRRWREATNPDVLAFHEAFADLVALFRHFTLPEALKDQIARTRGDLGQENLLAELARQFGDAIGLYGPLRSAIGRPVAPVGADGAAAATAYQTATEPHDRGAVLVAAVFDAFLSIYRSRSEDLVRLATGGTGVLPPGAIPHDLVRRLAEEASKTASQVLNMCIRAIDYCPPVDLNFGDFLRALITADVDLVPDDPRGYRVAFVEAFRRRGIYPNGVRSLATDGLVWEAPDLDFDVDRIVGEMDLGWNLQVDRRSAFEMSQLNAVKFHAWLKGPNVSDDDVEQLGFVRTSDTSLAVGQVPGTLSSFEVHSVRPLRRVGPDGQQRLDLVVEVTQTWTPKDANRGYRGGCTLLIDLENRRVQHCVRKRVGNAARVDAQQGYANALASTGLRSAYFTSSQAGREPFAMLHGRE
jgi:hypothetical protein